jgi:hypothetical protein
MRQNRLLSLRRMTSLFLCAVFMFSLIATAEGQSGRRPPKRPPEPEPPPTQNEPPVSSTSTQDKKGATPILLAGHLDNIFISSDIYLRVVAEGFMERLEKVAGVKARAGMKDINRKEASDAAKSSEETYVVWFQLANDTMSGGNPAGQSVYSLYIEYVIFSPVTGKARSSGHIYQRPPRGTVGAPLPTPNPRTSSRAEYSLRYAGVELAERALDSLNLHTTPPIH